MIITIDLFVSPHVSPETVHQRLNSMCKNTIRIWIKLGGLTLRLFQHTGNNCTVCSIAVTVYASNWFSPKKKIVAKK